MKTLIVYFSQSRGNTKGVAEMIHQETGYDLCRIETAVPYTGSYNDIVSQGQQEVRKHYQPQLKPLQADLGHYDRFIVMTPTWWYTMAPAVLTFLSGHDFTGKTVIPVQTHGGWPGHVLKDMAAAAKGAVVEKGFAVQFDSTGGSKMITDKNDIIKWIKSIQ